MVRRTRPGISRFRVRCLASPRNDGGFTKTVRARLSLLPIPEIRLDRAVHLDGERVAVAVFCVAGGYANPAFADAIFLDIGLLLALEADADIARQNLGVVVGAARIDRQPVRQLLVHRIVVLVVHNRASISSRNPSGLAVGASRATTLPARSTTNLVKFHLIDGPSRPDFAPFRC